MAADDPLQPFGKPGGTVVERRTKWLVSAALVAIATLAMIVVLDPHRVRWEIIDERRTAEYIDALGKYGIPYEIEVDHLGKKYVVTEGYPPKELREITGQNR